MIRKSTALFFLCLYTLVLFKPLFPFVDYAINKDYIVKNFCENRAKPKLNCNGKCHLMKEIKKAGAEQGLPLNNNQQKNNSSEESNVHMPGFFAFSSFLNNEKQIFRPTSFAIFSSPAKGIFHPPCLA